MSAPRYPALYQMNPRVWLTELSRAPGRRATLDDILDAGRETKVKPSAAGIRWRFGWPAPGVSPAVTVSVREGI